MNASFSREAREWENVELLTAMMGSDLDSSVARRVLRKFDGDVQKAATAIIDGDRGEEPQTLKVDTRGVTCYDDSSATHQVAPVPHASNVIDLTADDDEDDYKRALKASLGTEEGSKFRPSNRSPNPDWAVVPSNAKTSTLSHDDQTLNQAIIASLNSGHNDFNDEVSEVLSLEESVRDGGRPIALRPLHSAFSYAALIFQGLFFVPQIRDVVARLRPAVPRGAEDSQTPRTGPEFALWNLIEMFTNMDLAVLSTLASDELLTSFEVENWSAMIQRPGDLSAAVLEKIAELLENEVNRLVADGEPRIRLFNFRHGRIDLGEPILQPSSAETCFVSVDVGGNNPASNDLISRLAADLSRFPAKGSNHDVIFEPSQVVAFHLRNSTPSSVDSKTVVSNEFRYPKSLYLDQFLSENLEFANQKRAREHEIHAEMEELSLKRKSITHFNDRDTLADLRASLHYCEEVIEAKDDLERQEAIQRTALQLRKIIATMEDEIQRIDLKIADLKDETAVLFDCPELQEHKYDLRVVLMHTGLFGRKNVYSYVQDQGVWWKTVDYIVTEVPEETVLTDPTGLHLEAGPYILIYSRSLPEETRSLNSELPWPEIFKARVQHNNKQYIWTLPPEIAAKALTAHTYSVVKQSSPTEPGTHSAPGPMDVGN